MTSVAEGDKLNFEWRVFFLFISITIENVTFTMFCWGKISRKEKKGNLNLVFMCENKSKFMFDYFLLPPPFDFLQKNINLKNVFFTRWMYRFNSKYKQVVTTNADHVRKLLK